MGVGAVKESVARARWMGSISPREAKLSLVVVTVSVKISLHAARTLVWAVRVLAPRAMRSGTGSKKIVRKKMTPEAAPALEGSDHTRITVRASREQSWGFPTAAQ
jgi:hypothetical protein